jgi:alpha-beta hydrolase superfamily lysophospholipase
MSPFFVVPVAIGLVLVSLILLVGCVITLRAFRAVTHPGHETFLDYARFADGLVREAVHFASLDGTRLAGWFVPGPLSKTVLLIHGYTACKDDMLAHAAFLHEAGYSLFLFDLRACGDSEGTAVTLGGREREDVQAAIAYLASRDDVDAGGIGVLGLSLGGALAILAACDSPLVRAVVAESAFRSIRSAVRQNFRRFTRLPSFPWAEMTTRLTEWRYRVSALRVAPERDVMRLERCALLLIHAEDDRVISVRDAAAIFERAPEPKEFWRIPSAEHAMALGALPQEYAHRVVAFFDRWLLGADGRDAAD